MKFYYDVYRVQLARVTNYFCDNLYNNSTRVLSCLVTRVCYSYWSYKKHLIVFYGATNEKQKYLKEMST